MAQPGAEAGLAHDPPPEVGVGLGVDDLDGDVAVERLVAREVDDPHPARPDLPRDAVPARQQRAGRGHDGGNSPRIHAASSGSRRYERPWIST